MNGNGTVRRQPLDIEEILRKKKEADAAAAKPRFMTKAQREALAAKKAQEEKEKEEEKQRQKQQAPLDKAPSYRNGNRDSYTNGKTDKSRDYSIPTGPKAMRDQNGHQDRGQENGNSRSEPPKPAVSTKGSKRLAEQDETSLIRARYMGPEMNQSTFSAKKKRKRTTEKKFNFEWDAEEDTSQDQNPIYAEQTTSFWAGKLGGFGEDVAEESAKKFARQLEDADPEHGRERAREYLEQWRRGRERATRNGLGKHWSEKKLDEMRERDWRIFKEDFGIATKGGAIPNPMRSWKESGLPRRLLEVVDQVGYTEPTPIQRAAIPIALQARDLIGVAVTGSGKTAAFLLPLLVYISGLPPLDEYTKADGPYALILAPTRELAQQIESEAKKFATPLGFTCVSIVGGHSLEEQAFNLRNGAEIIVATPGRLVDTIERRLLVLSQCCYIVMDEADRMIDLGFEESLNKILDALPVGNEKPDTEEAENTQLMSKYIGGKDRYRQTMMYTATMPTAVEKIAKKYLRRPAIVTIGNAGEAVETVEQRVEFVGGEDKRKKRLGEILNSGQFQPPIIVFVNIKRNCDTVARDIKHLGYSAVTLHGSKTQEQREAALASLRNHQTDILVATDLAGRGIDVPDVSLVINFNMATNIESYTHRVGRTGRAGKSGVAITFLGNEDEDVLYDLKQMIQKSSISKVPDELRRHPAAQQKPVKGRKVEDVSAPGSFGKGGGGQW
ncbi:putative pre-mrna-splicing atp-dependent rna helicase prp28 protein [Phaeoacremonium minimum UCRPA7]|uniref:RNA helicase n=1 Tax=Phaeoacremonium minimum (strain UCR-PA7) TaxID=1286976 RepID=R8BSY1_PHAM7|nr:putative pre-mrna-splicing atp-dependent rna helicase prp28 protein [Phaeoacremonium minimum UCRPA7]EOO02492.1 putative pre-mrna-splicing atp-dependent rna helicase prp28 protein [Phaeoacremonium minimum UCRPA7]